MEVEKIIESFVSQGLLGVILVCVGWYLLHKEKKHEAERRDLLAIQVEERKEWKEIAKQSVDANKENANAMREHSSMMSALKTLLETTREKK